MEQSEQIGCGYCKHEGFCETREARVNKAKLGCKSWKHFADKTITLDTSLIVDAEVEGIDKSDAPKYCDAFISEAYYPTLNEEYRELKEAELTWLSDERPDFVLEQVEKKLH